MKKNIRIISIKLIIITIFTIFLVGCATVEQTIYLGDVDVEGPVVVPPTHLSNTGEAGKFTVSPHVSFLNKKEIIGSTNDRYSQSFRLTDSTSYSTKKDNFYWNVSEYTMGVDLNLQVSNAFSIFGGVDFSGGNGTNSLNGGNFGIGLHSHLKNPNVRIDLGASFQKYNYFAITIVHTKTTYQWGDDVESTEIFGDKGNSVNINPFFTLTINSNNDSSLINYFGTIGFFTQSILNFNPGESHYPFFPLLIEQTTIDERANFNNSFFYLNPGISFKIDPQMSVILSAKILADLSIEKNNVFVVPSIQMDFQF